MSNTTARVHGNKSNRAVLPKKKEQPETRKTVFKSVLDNPYEIQWPLVPLNVQNLLLARAVTVLDGVAEYNGARSRANRKRKRLARAAEKDERQAKRRKTDGGNSEPDAAAMSTGTARTASLPVAHPAASPGMEDHTNEPTVDLGPPPAVVRHTYIGINEVTKRLEFQAGAVRRALVVRPGEVAEPPLPPLHPVRVVLVCMNDVDPLFLIAHLPHLVASCNTPRTSAGLLNVKLIPLPKGAEAVLAEATGLRRASVVAFEAGAPNLELLEDLLDSVPTVVAPWLAQATSISDTAAVQYEPTHIKQLRTTAPKDMKAAKERRVQGKAEAKARQQEAGIIRKKARKTGPPISQNPSISASGKVNIGKSTVTVKGTSQRQRAKVP